MTEGSDAFAALVLDSERGPLPNEDLLIEACAVANRDTRTLTYYTCHVSWEERQVCKANLATLWPGWTVVDAWNGVRDIEEALPSPSPPPPLAPFREPLLSGGGTDEIMCLLTIADGPSYGFQAAPVDAFLPVGPALLDRLPAESEVWYLDTLPFTGIHLDPATRTGGYWTTGTVPARPFLRSLWPGWTLNFWEDRYVEQATRDDLTFPAPDFTEALSGLAPATSAELLRKLTP